MDIAITDDPRLCRQKHLSVTYDRRSDHFYIKNENGSVFVNNSPVQKAMEFEKKMTQSALAAGAMCLCPIASRKEVGKQDENR